MKTVVLTFDDAVTNQLGTALPVLREFGFNATFYVCRFSQEWRKKNEPFLLTWEQIRTIDKAGFEIGNHTLAHQKITEDDIVAAENAMHEHGITHPDTFAYPGGPYCPEVVPFLQAHGYRAARTVESRPVDLRNGDRMRLPSYAIDDKSNAFQKAMSALSDDAPVVLVYHGIPEFVHPWCSTRLSTWLDQMNFLHDNNFHVISTRRFCDEFPVS